MKTVVLFVVTTLLAVSARAQSLLGDSCVSISGGALIASLRSESQDLDWSQAMSYAMPVQTQAMGLTCNDIRAVQGVVEVVHVAIVPAMLVLKSPMVRAGLVAELAALGIAGSPAIMGATVIGYFGIVTINMVLKRSLEDCEKADREAFKNEILREMEMRYGIKGTPQTSLQISH